MQAIQSQEQQQAALAEHKMASDQAMEEAKLKELYSKAANNIAMARERHGRNEANIGLFEERLSEVQKNQALAVKDKMEAIEKMIDVIAKYGEVEALLAEKKIESYDYRQDIEEDTDKAEAKRTAAGNEFIQQVLGQVS